MLSARWNWSGTSSTPGAGAHPVACERIDVATDGTSVTLHAAGIRGLVVELTDQEPPAPAASDALLEAAE